MGYFEDIITIEIGSDEKLLATCIADIHKICYNKDNSIKDYNISALRDNGNNIKLKAPSPKQIYSLIEDEHATIDKQWVNSYGEGRSNSINIDYRIKKPWFGERKLRLDIETEKYEIIDQINHYLDENIDKFPPSKEEKKQGSGIGKFFSGMGNYINNFLK